MSRIVRFRVWRDAFTWPHLDRHEPAGWLSDRYIGALGSCHLGRDGWGNDEVYFDRGTEEMGGKVYVEQFTGLLDSKGREIYEGDIVRRDFPNDISEPFELIPTLMEVWFDPERAQFTLKTPIRGYVLSSRWNVVGNVHQNPELLKP